MTYTIRKEFPFSASHRLDHLPDGHKCARDHGHNYMVEVILEAEQTNEQGFVIDYGDLSPLGDHINEKFDHRHLNEVMGEGLLTTAEHLAVYFYKWCKARWTQTVAVRVSETPKTWAEYREPHRSPADNYRIEIKGEELTPERLEQYLTTYLPDRVRPKHNGPADEGIDRIAY